MYRGGSSPIFEVPEFPSLRRVKPLPKRRRTSESPPRFTTHRSQQQQQQQHQQPLEVLGPDATAEEILAHADSLSARMAHQSYYMPILGGMQNFLASAGIDPAGGIKSDGGGGGGAVDFGLRFGGADDEQGDGDYVDHLQQPGNTKKRKVPANASNSPRGAHDASGGGGGAEGDEDEPTDRGIPTGRSIEASHDSHNFEPYSPSLSSTNTNNANTTSSTALATTLTTLSQKRGKLTAATLAGLQHKEMLKNRKRQLAAVLGALSHGDTLALDQALSANYPFSMNAASGFDDLRSGGGGAGAGKLRVRLSKRKVVRAGRVARLTRVPRHPDAVPFPSGEFTFVSPSATADRLIATKEEVALLRSRFEAELERQAAKAAKLAAASKLMAASLPAGKGGKTKRSSEHHQRKARMISSGSAKASVEGQQQQQGQTQSNQSEVSLSSEQPGASLALPKPRGKKKKRSALANASNPHHLRNYIPSRLPHSGGTNAAALNAQNTLWSLPLRFLAAEIPPRRRKKAAPPPPVAPAMTNPADEWICPFCEYNLFYGDEAAYRKAIRSRKKILRRRRRARERAALAASGKVKVKSPENEDGEGDDGEEGDEEVGGEEGGGMGRDEFATLPKQTKWRGDPNKDRGGLSALSGEQAGYG